MNKLCSVDYYVSVESFVPRSYVDHMLQIIDKIEKLEPIETASTFINLRRAMAWMGKYIFPTSEFWEWHNDEFKIDNSTSLYIKLLGSGWTLSLRSRKPINEDELGGEEKRLNQILDELTNDMPVRGILRLKASPWSKTERNEVLKYLKLNKISTKIQGTKLVLIKLGITIETEPEERVNCKSLNRKLSLEFENVLQLLKTFFNKNHEGAGWCAYQIRRLTIVQKIGSMEISEKDKRFLKHPEYGMSGKIMSSTIEATNGFSGIFCFLRTHYHIGNFHPRAMIVPNNQSQERLDDFTTYVFYLWHSHFTKIWLYLLFEDVYIYASKLRASKKYVDFKIHRYWQNLLKTDDILNEMESYTRLDKGEFESYRPPHKQYSEPDAETIISPSPIGPIKWLREYLIEATTTELHSDPLERAIEILKKMDFQMKTSLNLFVQTIGIQIQQTLKILQILFVIAAVGQVIQILGPIFTRIINDYLSSMPRLKLFLASIISNNFNLDALKLLIFFLFIIFILTLLRSTRIKEFISRIFN